MTVRVIRILEYTYPSHERCEQDMQRWKVGANSVQRHGDMTISSATMMPRTVAEDERTLGEVQASVPEMPQLPLARLGEDGRLVDDESGLGIMLDELVERYNDLARRKSG